MGSDTLGMVVEHACYEAMAGKACPSSFQEVWTAGHKALPACEDSSCLEQYLATSASPPTRHRLRTFKDSRLQSNQP